MNGGLPAAGVGSTEGWLDRLFAVDFRGLGALRIGIAILLLVDLAGRLSLLELFFTDSGPVPRTLVRSLDPDTLSLHLLSGELGVQSGLWCLAAVFALQLLVGLWTRLATAACWVLLVSAHQRAEVLLDGGDQILGLLLFWGLFLPLGACWSIDARRRGENAMWAGTAGTSPRMLSLASAALVLQPVFVYFFAGFNKLYGAEWRDGTAVLFALGHDIWERPMGTFLASMPWAVTAMTYTTLLVEIGAALAILSPFRTALSRTLTVFGLVAFQASLAFCLQLNLFPFASTVMLLPLLPASSWNWLEARLSRKRGEPSEMRLRPPALVRSRLVTNLIALPFLVFAIVSNVESASPVWLSPSELRSQASRVGLLQDWSMYAPSPYRYDFRLLIRESISAQSGRAGRMIDDHGATASWEPMERIRSRYRSKVYLEWVSDIRRPGELRSLGLWICREWNASHGPSERVERVELILEERLIVLEGSRPRATRQRLRLQECGETGEPNDPDLVSLLGWE